VLRPGNPQLNARNVLEKRHGSVLNCDENLKLVGSINKVEQNAMEQDRQLLGSGLFMGKR
jgi:hypothetical protein